MISPFDLPMRATATWLKLYETMAASAEVIEARRPVIEDAMRTPSDANRTELWGMGAEKVEAFGEAGMAFWSGIVAMNQSMVAQWMDIGRVASRGSLPLLSDYGRIANRSMRLAEGFSRSGDAALAPIHRKATANAKRLRKKR